MAFSLHLVYCWCKREEFGEMIQCDNPHCPAGWYHFECVNITMHDLQKKKWYCSDLCKNYEKLCIK